MAHAHAQSLHVQCIILFDSLRHAFGHLQVGSDGSALGAETGQLRPEVDAVGSLRLCWLVFFRRFAGKVSHRLHAWEYLLVIAPGRYKL